jgi:multidrug resistance efflux pump
LEQCKIETKSHEELAKLGFVSDAALKAQQYLLAGKAANYGKAKALYDLTILGTTPDVKRVADLAVADAKKRLEAAKFNVTADLTAAQATLELAQIDLDNCARDLAKKRKDFERATVRAPARGRVAFIDVWKGPGKSNSPIQVGETRVAGGDLCIVCDTSAFRIGVWINESDISRVRLKQHAVVKLPAFPGRTFEAVVAELGSVAVDKNTALSSLALKSAGEAFVNVVQAKLDFIGLADEDRQAMRINFIADVSIQLDGPEAGGTPAAGETAQ